jgi:hypothetical protein
MTSAEGGRFAVVCIAHNEQEIIQAFVDHYLDHGAATVIVVDNDSTDETVARARTRAHVVIEPLPSGELDEELRSIAFQRMRRACIGRTDWVVLADCDEFLVPKDGGSIRETLAACADAEILGTEGWDVVQQANEPPMCWQEPILVQRGFGVANPHYDKPIVLRPGGRERLVPGQHDLIGPRRQPERRPFWLLHFAACDRELFFTRRLQMTARQGETNIRKGLSMQHTGQTRADVEQRWRALQEHRALRPLPTRSAS